MDEAFIFFMLCGENPAGTDGFITDLSFFILDNSDALEFAITVWTSLHGIEFFNHTTD